MKRIGKIALVVAVIIIVVVVLIFVPMVPTRVFVGSPILNLGQYTTAYVSPSFHVFGFGAVYVQSELWRSCSGFYWNYQMGNFQSGNVCIVQIT